MKKLLLLIPVLMFAVLGCKGNADAGANSQADIAQFQKYIQELQEGNTNIKVEKLADIKEMPGFAYVKITGDGQEKMAITNGRLLIDAQIIDLKDKVSVTSIYNGIDHGGEVTSPILHDNKKAWSDLKTACLLIRHNFEYGVTSKKNKGTTFYFKISK